MALLSSSSSSSCCTQAVVPHSVLQQQQQQHHHHHPHLQQQHHHHPHLQQRPKWLAPCCRPRAGPVSFYSVQQCSSAKSVFSGYHAQLADCVWAAAPSSTSIRPIVCMTKPSIQFIKGIDEQTVPNVSLTKSRDGTNGVATFLFDQPSVFDSSRELGDITGLYLLDEEGVLQSVDVSAKFVNGKPAKIEAKYIMRTSKDWDRFMRFMERYAEANGLGFVKK